MTAVSTVLLASSDSPTSPAGTKRKSRPERWAVEGCLQEARQHAPRVRSDAPGNDDASLVARLLQRDDAAWCVFLQRYDPTALRAIARVVRCAGRVDPSTTEEIRAEWLCALVEDDMRKLRSFDAARGALGAFLHVLATRAAFTHLRRRARHRWETSLDDEARVLIAFDADPGQLLDDARERSALRGALRELSAHDRAFFELLYVEEQTAEQVARTLQVAVETVYTRKVRVQRRLQRVQDRTHRGCAPRGR